MPSGFTFDVGFDKPPHLSINTSNELVVGSGPTVLVKLKAINRIDATETEMLRVLSDYPSGRDTDMAKRIGVDDACGEQL